MIKFVPDVYQKNIFSIDYKKLKSGNIKILLFDFDNTIIEKGNNLIEKKTVELIKKLKKDFQVYVVSNSMNDKKLKKVCDELDILYISDSRKPLKKGYKKLNLDVDANEVAMIGDQLITDVIGAHRMGYFSILIDPINSKEFFITKLNRLAELLVFKVKKFKRGDYYD